MKTKIALVLIAVAIVYEATSGNKADDPTKTPNTGAAQIASQDPRSFDRLAPEHKKFVDDTYNLALTLYTTGKYEQSSIELEKIFKMVSNYKDSKNIYQMCQQAIDIIKQQAEQERIKREQEELTQKVNQTLDQCQALYDAKSYTKVEDCVAQIANSDPGNQRGSDLVIKAKTEEDKIEASATYKTEMAENKNRAYVTMAKAEKNFHERKYIAALRDFEVVRGIAFVDPENIKAKASNGIKEARGCYQKTKHGHVPRRKVRARTKRFWNGFLEVDRGDQVRSEQWRRDFAEVNRRQGTPYGNEEPLW